MCVDDIVYIYVVNVKQQDRLYHNHMLLYCGHGGCLHLLLRMISQTFLILDVCCGYISLMFGGKFLG